MSFRLEELNEQREVLILLESENFEEIIKIISKSYDFINKPNRVAIKAINGEVETVMSYTTINRQALIEAGLLQTPKVKSLHF